MVLGSLPPIGFLLWTQWWMYGDPFKPGQFHMTPVNFTGRGMKGFGVPDLEVFNLNLISPDWGLVPFAPILVLAVIPAFFYARDRLITPGRELMFIRLFSLAFLVFCAANQYSRMQFNTGFRYLLPIVPFLFLAAAEHLARFPRWLLFLVGAATLANSWVLAMVRFTRPTLEEGPDTLRAWPECWQRLLEEGLMLPWLTVLRQTTADASSPVHWRILPFALVLLTFLFCWWIWRLGAVKENPATVHESKLSDGSSEG